MKKYKLGLVVGRFQPFHLGHKYLIEKSLDHCDQIIIGIGSSNITNEVNPYSYMKRKKIVEEFVKKEQIQDRVKKVISLVDHPDDQIWLQKLLKKTGKVDVVIGDNVWVNGIFKNAGINIIKIGFYKREILEGKLIRALIKDNKEWKTRVPEYLVKYLLSK